MSDGKPGGLSEYGWVFAVTETWKFARRAALDEVIAEAEKLQDNCQERADRRDEKEIFANYSGMVTGFGVIARFCKEKLEELDEEDSDGKI